MRRDLQFMGRITAGITHEINNVLAVIRETAGLAQDLTTLADPEGFRHRERALQCLEEIQRQIQRGADVTRSLNRFSHSVDNEREAVSMQEFAELAVAINKRMARQCEVALEALPSSDPVTLEVNPFLVLEALSRLIAEAVKGLNGPGRVLVSAAETDTGRARSVRIWPEGESISGPVPEPDLAADLIEELSQFGLAVEVFDGHLSGGWLLRG